MSKPWQPYAQHILDAIEKIYRIQKRGDLTKDDILYDAILRNLQTLSEATQLLPESLKQEYPQIPWREISGFRNILVHNYLGDIDSLTITMVIEKHIPELEEVHWGDVEINGGPGRITAYFLVGSQRLASLIKNRSGRFFRTFGLTINVTLNPIISSYKQSI